MPMHAGHFQQPGVAFPPSLTAGPGYQRAAVTSFYAPYLLVPLLLALHMAATPQPFGSPAGKAKRQ